MANVKSMAKRLLQSEAVAETIIKLNRVVNAGYQGDIFKRFDTGQIFRDLFHGSRDVSKEQFAGLKTYVLTDQPIAPEHQQKLGPIIATLDEMTDAEIAQGLFYIYFLCDSDALASLRRITAAGGKYVPHLSFDKTEYRFIDRLAHDAMRRTWAKRERVSHLTPIVHENICEALSITRHIEGDYVEIGVFRGGSALTAINYIDEARTADPSLPARKAWLLDTFDGFNYDEAFNSPDAIWAGTHALSGVDKTMGYITETLSGTSVPFELVASNICADALPAGIRKIAVANIDVDMFEPTLDAMNKVSPLMAPGGIMICEDPASTPGLYGAYQAMEDFLGSELGKGYLKLFKRGQYYLVKMPG